MQIIKIQLLKLDIGEYLTKKTFSNDTLTSKAKPKVSTSNFYLKMLERSDTLSIDV